MTLKRFGSRPVWRLMLLAVVPIAVVLYALFVPFAWSPYVRIPGATVELHINCEPKEIVIASGPGHSEPRTIAVDRRSTIDTRDSERLIQQTQATSVENRVVRFRFPPSDLAASAKLSDQHTTFVAVVEFSRSPFVDIKSVSVVPAAIHGGCAPETIAGKLLIKAIERDGARLMRYRMVQDSVSDVVLLFNSSVGNLMLAGMLVYLVWALMQLGTAFWTRHVRSEAELKARIGALHAQFKGEGATLDEKDTVLGRALRTQRQLAMAKVLGPAFGFLLTVSSLAAALHPAVQARQDAFQFISAIQIAVLSTLLGLAIRIVAQVASAWVRDGTERQLLALQVPTEK